MRNLLFLLALIAVITSCTPKKEKLENEISQHEEVVFNDEMGLVDTVATELLKNYREFAELYPEDKNTPSILYKGADLANGLGMPTLAIDMYGQVYQEFPEYEKAPLSLFIAAFIQENQMRNLDEAKALYEKFLEDYPNHQLTPDVKVTLKNLGKTPEEIIQEFEQQQAL